MNECICNSCRNLKGVVGGEGEVRDYECEFGFPSDKCTDCEGEGCEETCSHYVCDEGEDPVRVVTCCKCGRELKQVMDDVDGEVYCFDCYLGNGNK